jgi:hypothetical protein
VWINKHRIGKTAGVGQQDDRTSLRIVGDYDFLYGLAVLAGVRIGRFRYWRERRCYLFAWGRVMEGALRP